jgi:hypothetical protein
MIFGDNGGRGRVRKMLMSEKEMIIGGLRWLYDKTITPIMRDDDFSLFQELAARVGRERNKRLGTSEVELGSVEEKKQRVWIVTRMWLLRWAQSAFPVVSLSENQTAAFALADVPAEEIEKMRMPWKAFSIRFPIGSLKFENKNIFRIAIHRGLYINPVHASLDKKYKETITLRIDVEPNITMNKTAGTLKGLLEEWGTLDLGQDHEIIKPEDTNVTDRLFDIAFRIVANVLFTMNNKYLFKSKDRDRKIRIPGIAKKLQIKTAEYIVTEPVKINLIDKVRDYISGVLPHIYKSRWLVRGHWRNQACGIAMQDHRRKFIEPYWKGPIMGSKLIRDYEIEDRSAGCGA